MSAELLLSIILLSTVAALVPFAIYERLRDWHTDRLMRRGIRVARERGLL